MTSDMRAALAAFARGALSLDELVARLAVDPRQSGRFILSALEHALSARATDDVESLCTLAARTGAWPEWAAVLARLLLEDWHTQHDDIADLLQNLREPSTIDALFACAERQFTYRDYDDADSLAVRCLWAIHDIGTAEGAERLRILARSERPRVREEAARLLARLEARTEGDPAEPYRVSRDAKVHGRRPRSS